MKDAIIFSIFAIFTLLCAFVISWLLSKCVDRKK